MELAGKDQSVSNTPNPNPQAISQDIIAAAAAGSIAQSILVATGKNQLAEIIPLAESLLATAIQAFTAAAGKQPTVEQFQALLGGDPVLNPPSA